MQKELPNWNDDAYKINETHSYFKNQQYPVSSKDLAIKQFASSQHRVDTHESPDHRMIPKWGDLATKVNKKMETEKKVMSAKVPVQEVKSSKVSPKLKWNEVATRVIHQIVKK